MPDNEQLRAEIERLKKELFRSQSALKQKESRVVQLEIQLKYLKQKLFGTGKSEKVDPAQRELMLGQIERLEKEIQEHQVPAHKRKKRNPLASQDERYEHLPIEDEREIIPEEVRNNPDAYERTGASEDTFEIDYHGAHFFRRRLIRPKFRLKSDRQKPLVIAPAPVRVVSGLASSNLLALIMIQKFVDHLPLARQVKIFKRHGCVLSVKSMMRWVEKVSIWIEPIYDQMLWELLQGNYLQVDESPVTFCDPDQGVKKSKKGYFCVTSRPDDHIVFTWSKTRSDKDITTHLAGFKGLLQSDGWPAYGRFAHDNDGVELLGCMAHCRRKFVEAEPYNARESKVVIKLMQRLYHVEKLIRESETELSNEQILELRKKFSSNTLSRIKRVLDFIEKTKSPQQPVRKATDYALNQWKHLIAYINHGQAQIDNNLAENAIRPTAVGKKNWLFIGHPNAGGRAAKIYSILISCERAGINAQQYLNMILAKQLTKLSKDQLSQLTPKAYAHSMAKHHELAA